MDDVARPAAEDGVEFVFAGHRKADVASVFEARKSITEIPTPGPLADVARKRTGVADLRRADDFGRFCQHGVLFTDKRMMAERVERDQTADFHAAALRSHLIQPLDSAQMDQRVRGDDAFLHQLQHVANALRIGVTEGFHANTSRILSRVMGRCLRRLPMALKMALLTAATAG